VTNKAAIALTIFASAACAKSGAPPAAKSDSSFAALQQRGETAMGVNQYRFRHHRKQLARIQIGHPARHRHDLGYDRRLLDVLAQVPRPTFVAGHQLQVASRHVEAAGISVDQGRRVRRRGAKARLADRDDQLHFMVVVLRLGRVSHGGAGFDQRRRCLVK